MGVRVWRWLLTITAITTVPTVGVMASEDQGCEATALRQAIASLADPQQRSPAQQTLEGCGETAVPFLATALSADATTRQYAAETLGNIGWAAQSAVPELVLASQEDRDLAVRSEAIQALSAIAQEGQTQANQWSGWQTGNIQDLQILSQRLDQVWTAVKNEKTDWATKAEDLETLRLTRNALQTQIRTLTEQPSYQVVSWVQTHPIPVAIAVVLVAIGGSYLAIFIWHPLTLLKLGDTWIARVAAIPHVGVPASQFLQALLPFKYHPHVLDAWVAQHLQTATTNFTRPTNKTVSDRAIHVPLPVKINGSSETEFSPQTLLPYFQQRVCLLITGEGGAGKTSLACQIARWGLAKKLAKSAILPILIEQELEESDNLLDIVQGALQRLVAAEEPLEQALVTALLRKRRLLVIVDHLSELSKTTRTKIRPTDPDFPIHALIVTSRLPEDHLDSDLEIEPMRVEGNRLSEFIHAYLTAKEKRHLFEDEDYFEVCRRLSRIVGQRNITVLLARLYADQAIEQQEGAGGTLPDSVPELMLSYLNQLNRTIEPENQRDRLQVQRDAQTIAWKCLEETYRPTATKTTEAIAALVAQGMEAEEATQRLHYLEERLRLLQTLEPGDKLRIILDPLAEYLAARWLVEWFHAPSISIQTAPRFLATYLQELIEAQSNRADPAAMWHQFLVSIDHHLDRTNDPPDAIQGFLLAVRDCCLAKQREDQIPAFLPEELARKAGLDPEDLRQAEEKRRIRLLISELSAPELKYRIRAAEDLSQLGARARMAAPNLIGMLENPNQSLEARQAAAQALGKLGIGAESLLALLTQANPSLDETPDETLAVRCSAAEALGRMNAGQSELRQILERGDHPLLLRQSAARALCLIGAPSGEAIPMLLVNVQPGSIIPEVKSIPVWKEALTADLTLDLVDIPAGEFQMGSPPHEEARDWYKYAYPELEGVDVEFQHRVAVPRFWMSQFPITQAQWRFVASLPPIDRNLNPDPANFKGDARPVEQVSWYDAMEFCARLSQHTGKPYRLPSEAEWEYACRAGTSHPFHLGETLSTDLANYDGTYAYGSGSPGHYRQQTTEVGSFGVVNACGLADMHGNVWEWCLDSWHPSYQDAPTDGSAWVADGDDRYRVLRGGSWYNGPGNCRSAYRDRVTPGTRYNVIGFRVVCGSPWTM